MVGQEESATTNNEILFTNKILRAWNEVDYKQN